MISTRAHKDSVPRRRPPSGPGPRSADVHVRRQLVGEAEVGTAVPDHAERGLVGAVRVLAATILHVHHEGTLMREAIGCAGISRVAVDGVTGARLVAAAGGLDVDHARELVLCAEHGPAVAFHAEVGVRSASCGGEERLDGRTDKGQPKAGSVDGRIMAQLAVYRTRRYVSQGA